MSNKKFDDFFKQSFSDYSPEVPGRIWDNIAAQQKKKRPAGFWVNNRKVLLIATALLLLAGGTYLIIAPKSKPQNISLENNGSGQEAVNAAPAAVLQNKAAANAAQANVSKDGKPTISDNTGNVMANNKDESASINNKKLPQGDDFRTIDNDSKSNRFNKNIINTKGDITVANNTLPAKMRGKLRSSKKYKQQVSAPEAEDLVDVSNDNSSEDLLSSDDLNVPYVPGIRDLILLSKENLLDKQILQLTPPKPREDCPGATGKNYYVEAYISPDYVIKKYSDTANSSLVTKRKESLSFQSAYSAGVRYTRVFANGMSIRAGLNFSQVNEKFSYVQGNVVQIVYVINTQGDTTDSYYVRGTRYKNSYNRYRTIDVPVVIGYEMGNGNFHANINAGVMVNLYSWQNGETIDNNGSPVSITTGKDDNPYQYKTNIGVGFTSAVSLYYKLSDKFHILAEPYFRYNFSPMNKDALSIQERFTTIGLRLGIRMDIK